MVQQKFWFTKCDVKDVFGRMHPDVCIQWPFHRVTLQVSAEVLSATACWHTEASNMPDHSRLFQSDQECPEAFVRLLPTPFDVRSVPFI